MGGRGGGGKGWLGGGRKEGRVSLFVAVCGVIRFRTRLRLLHTPPLNLIDPSMAFLLLATLPSRDSSTSFCPIPTADHRALHCALGVPLNPSFFSHTPKLDTCRSRYDTCISSSKARHGHDNKTLKQLLLIARRVLPSTTKHQTVAPTVLCYLQQ